MQIEKRPGPDWEITYEIDGETDVMVVFGAQDREAAIADALATFWLDTPKIISAEVLK